MRTPLFVRGTPALSGGDLPILPDVGCLLLTGPDPIDGIARLRALLAEAVLALP